MDKISIDKMKKSEKISFYVPVFNSGAYLEKCLLSIASQEYPVFEIIVIDNCSTDNSMEIAASLKKRGVNLRIIKENKPGLANARNNALENAKGDFIASIDADCIIEKDWLSSAMKNFNEKSVAGVGGKLVENSRWRAVHLKQEWGNKRIINPPFLFGANTVFRTEALKSIGGYNARFSSNYEDVDISKRLISNNFKLVYEPRAIAHHMKKEGLFSLLKNVWAWGFYGNEPKSISDSAKRIVFNVKRPFELLADDLMNKRHAFLLIDFIIFFSNPFFDLKYYLLRLKKQYF